MKKIKKSLIGWVSKDCLGRYFESSLRKVLAMDTDWKLYKKAEEKDDIKVRITVEEI
jgi:hypothetical protein